MKDSETAVLQRVGMKPGLKTNQQFEWLHKGVVELPIFVSYPSRLDFIFLYETEPERLLAWAIRH